MRRITSRFVLLIATAAVLPLVKGPLKTQRPEGGFYLWIEAPIDDADFARRLHEQYNVLVLPGSFLARESQGVNPGRNRLRVALVAPLAECKEAVQRMMQLDVRSRFITSARRRWGCTRNGPLLWRWQPQRGRRQIAMSSGSTNVHG